jgi:hypothetical protein
MHDLLADNACTGRRHMRHEMTRHYNGLLTPLQTRDRDYKCRYKSSLVVVMDYTELQTPLQTTAATTAALSAALVVTARHAKATGDYNSQKHRGRSVATDTASATAPCPAKPYRHHDPLAVDRLTARWTGRALDYESTATVQTPTGQGLSVAVSTKCPRVRPSRGVGRICVNGFEDMH